MTRKKEDNGTKLREYIQATGLTQPQALLLVNAGLEEPIAESTWKSYLSSPSSARRRPCPDEVLRRAEKVLGKILLNRKK